HEDGALPRRSALPMARIACGLAPNIAPSSCNADPCYLPGRLLVARRRLRHRVGERRRKPAQHFLWHHLPELLQRARPVEQELMGEARLRLARVLLDERAQHFLPMARRDALPDDALAIGARREFRLGVIDESHAATHPGSEIVADLAQDDDGAAGHVLAAVGAAALDHGTRAGIAHGEALARLARGEQRAGGRAVE